MLTKLWLVVATIVQWVKVPACMYVTDRVKRPATHVALCKVNSSRGGFDKPPLSTACPGRITLPHKWHIILLTLRQNIPCFTILACWRRTRQGFKWILKPWARDDWPMNGYALLRSSLWTSPFTHHPNSLKPQISLKCFGNRPSGRLHNP